MFALFSRILKLSDHYKSRIQGAFVCAFRIHSVQNADFSGLCGFEWICK